jgi:DNA polymerase-4
MSRQILSLHLRNFYVTAERQQDSSLQTKPVVIVHRREVLDASAEAATCGVKPATPVSRVLRLCPEAHVVEFVPERYQACYQTVWDVLAQHTPLVEPTELHEGFFDLTGCLRREETLAQRVERIRQQFRDAAGMHCSLGGGTSKLVAKLAMPHDRYVSPAQTSEFLETTQIAELDCLDAKIRERLTRLGIDTLGRLSRVPENVLARHFGQTGVLLHRLSQGLDPSSVLPLYPPRREEVTQHFAPLEEDEAVLHSHLILLSDRLWEQLTQRGEEASAVELRIALSPQPSAINNPCATPDTRHAIQNPKSKIQNLKSQLPRPLPSSSRLFDLSATLFHQFWDGRPVSSLTLTVSDLCPKEAAQLSLWDSRSLHQLAGRLDETLCALRRRYGTLSILTGQQYRQRRQPRLADQILTLQRECLMRKAA